MERLQLSGCEQSWLIKKMYFRSTRLSCYAVLEKIINYRLVFHLSDDQVHLASEPKTGQDRCNTSRSQLTTGILTTFKIIIYTSPPHFKSYLQPIFKVMMATHTAAHHFDHLQHSIVMWLRFAMSLLWKKCSLEKIDFLNDWCLLDYCKKHRKIKSSHMIPWINQICFSSGLKFIC